MIQLLEEINKVEFIAVAPIILETIEIILMIYYSGKNHSKCKSNRDINKNDFETNCRDSGKETDLTHTYEKIDKDTHSNSNSIE